MVDLTDTYEEVREKSQACTVINGNLNNCYSKKDTALMGFKSELYPGKVPVGFKPIFEEIKEEDRATCKPAVNYNLTKECPGHSIYAEVCGIFLRMIKDAY